MEFQMNEVEIEKIDMFDETKEQGYFKGFSCGYDCWGMICWP